MSRLATYTGILFLIAFPAGAQSIAHATDAPAQPSTASPPPSTAPAVPSWGSLFRDLGGDFRRLASRETATVLGVGGGLSLAVHHEDVSLTRSASGSEALDDVFESGAVLGGGLAQIGGAFATYALGRVTSHPRMAVVGADLVRAQIVTAGLTQTIKLSVDRRRPDGGHFSFPSGHSSGAFATATVLQRHFGWKVAAPAFGLAAYVAGSRLQENRHFASDVVFGAALGIVSGRAVTFGHGKRTFAVAPFAAAGGGGIGVTLLRAQ